MNFAIVAAGPNAASPHHEPGERVDRAGEVVLCDFGGTMLAEGAGYCSDITRMRPRRRAAGRVRATLYAVLQRRAGGRRGRGDGRHAVRGRRRARPGASSPTPATATHFIHRTGHGIGIEEHEDPYIVAGNATALGAGHAFSVEPGIYLPGRFGRPPRGHRGRHRRRARRAQPRGPRPRRWCR